MKLRALRLWNVRKFANRGIALEGIGDGVNVLSAENEFGKSTSFDALHAIFFQPYSGTPKAVQMLRPYSGGSPQIEVDIETEAGRYRINKQYYGGKRALVTDIDTSRIVAQADEAEAWVSNLLRGGSSGPAGLLWVQQGVTEIGGGSRTEKDDERKVREDVLASVTGDEIELLTGGRRMVRVLDRTQSELDRLVTSTGKPKASGPYADVLKELHGHQEEENKLANQIEELQADLDSRRIKLARLADVADPATIEQRKADLNQAKLNLQQAEDHAERLLTAKKQQNLALGKHALAKERHDDFLTKMQTLSELTKKLVTDGKQKAEAKEILLKALTSDQSLRETLESRGKTIDDITQKLKDAIIAKASLEASTKLEEVQTRLVKAEKARQEMEMLQAECEALSIDDAEIESLDQLVKRIAVLESTVHVESSTLKIEYLDMDSPVILNEGKPVEGSQTLNISATEVFEIPNVGSLTITPSSLEKADEMRDELRTTREKLSVRLSKLGLGSINKAKEQQSLFKVKSSTLMIKKAELEAHSPEGLEKLRAHAAELETKIFPAPIKEFNINEIEGSLQTAKANFQKVNTAREVSRGTLEAAKEAHLRAEIAQKHTSENLNQLEHGLGIDAQRQANAQSLSDDYKRDATEAKGASALVDKLQTNAPDMESVRANYTRLNSTIERLELERETLGKEIAGLDGRIAISSDRAIEEIFEETRGKREAAEARTSVFQREVAALQILKQALEEARVAAKEQFFRPVMAELKPLLSLLLDEASITFDDTTLLPQSLARKGQDEDISSLSGGMREQLAILTRLAFARLLAKGGHPVPVILDDALVYSDDNRIERMFDALHRQANDIQILVFTCRQRAFEELGGNGLQITDWVPTD